MTPIRVGIAGYGVVGRKRYSELLKIDEVIVIAICDQNMDAMAGVDGPSKYREYTELLESCQLDALFVCLTNDVAAAATIAALSKGLHVFCEKPPARTLHELSDVGNVLSSLAPAPPVLMYGFNHRYHDSIEKAHELVSSKIMGEVVSMRGLYGKSKLITFNQTDWRTNKSIAGGGVLLDQGIHLVDLMTLFAGEFETVHSFVSSGFWGFDVEDNVFAVMKTESGVVASLVSTALQWQHKFELEITLTEGLIKLSGLLTGSKSYGEEKIQYAHADHSVGAGDLMETTIKFNADESWAKEVKHFVECIKTGASPRTGSFTDAMRTMRQVFRIYHADPTWQQ